jgi:hypothetical protein
MSSSNDINGLARLINEQFLAHDNAKFDCQALRLQATSSSGPAKTDLEAQLRLRIQERKDLARSGLNSQIELLQLLRGSGWTRIPFNIRTALDKTFPESGLTELQDQVQLGRETTISPSGQLVASNPNGMILSSFASRKYIC